MQHNDGDEQVQSPSIDFAFVTALPIERDALLRRLEGRVVVQDDFEPLTYYRGHICVPATGENYKVVAVMLLGMRNDEAAVSTVKVVERWQPAYVFMVGIAGGVPGKLALGDVVISDFVYYYVPAKRTPKGDQRRPQQFLSDRLLELVRLTGPSEPKNKAVPFTASDLTDRLLPAALRCAYSEKRALEVRDLIDQAQMLEPTPIQ